MKEWREERSFYPADHITRQPTHRQSFDVSRGVSSVGSSVVGEFHRPRLIFVGEEKTVGQGEIANDQIQRFQMKQTAEQLVEKSHQSSIEREREETINDESVIDDLLRQCLFVRSGHRLTVLEEIHSAVFTDQQTSLGRDIHVAETSDDVPMIDELR